MLVRQGTKIKDLAQLFSQKQFRITEPIINVIMVLVCLPILVCRDPKTMKSAIMISFTMAGMTMTTNFVCKMLATELFLSIRPELWAWMPIFIFAPVAFITLDSMKT
jgi:4-amino-4-deoxy-L-arabinose transferase-like glycosyltransferase